MTSKRWVRRLPPWIVFALLASVTLVGAQPVLPDVEFLLVVELSRTEEWIRLQDEVLGTPRELARPVLITAVAKRGESRSITIEQPHFTAEISNRAGLELVKVTVAGKVVSAHALGALTLFQHAVFDIQAGAVENQVMLTYGSAVLRGRFTYLKLGSP